MQLDMHYYGTYAMARAAGLKREVSQTIATAAQFVDDNAKNQDIELEDGSCIHAIATAHHAVDIQNVDTRNQRKVWVPFHFLPGNEGSTYKERLVCRKNSQIMGEVIEYVYTQIDKEYFPELVGIIAHVYADTFSHYGFSGITDKKNKVDQNSIKLINVAGTIKSYIEDKATSFVEKFKAEISELASLGHGAVYTYPDRPYLKWSFKYETTDRKTITHDNFSTFIEGSEALFNFFQKVGELSPNLKYAHTVGCFSEIEGAVKEVLSLQKPKQERIDAWMNKAKAGELFNSKSEDIPVYKSWDEDIEKLKSMNSGAIKNMNIYRFFQASSIYRTFILRDLLPKHKLIVG